MIAAEMKARSISMMASVMPRCNVWGRCDSGGSDRAPVEIVHRITGQAGHQAQDVECAGAEDEEIDDDEGHQRCANRGCRDRRDGIGSQKMTVDRVGLPADLGGDPSRKDGDETGRPHGYGGPVEPVVPIEGAAPATDEAPETEAEHGEADADHHPEGPEYDRYRRMQFLRHRIQAVERGVEAVLEDKAGELRDFDGIINPLLFLLRSGERRVG